MSGTISAVGNLGSCRPIQAKLARSAGGRSFSRRLDEQKKKIVHDSLVPARARGRSVTSCGVQSLFPQLSELTPFSRDQSLAAPRYQSLLAGADDVSEFLSFGMMCLLPG